MAKILDKNIDLTKQKIESILTGEISSHTHPTSAGGTSYELGENLSAEDLVKIINDAGTDKAYGIDGFVGKAEATIRAGGWGGLIAKLNETQAVYCDHGSTQGRVLTLNSDSTISVGSLLTMSTYSVYQMVYAEDDIVVMFTPSGGNVYVQAAEWNGSSWTLGTAEYIMNNIDPGIYCQMGISYDGTKIGIAYRAASGWGYYCYYIYATRVVGSIYISASGAFSAANTACIPTSVAYLGGSFFYVVYDDLTNGGLKGKLIEATSPRGSEFTVSSTSTRYTCMERIDATHMLIIYGSTSGASGVLYGKIMTYDVSYNTTFTSQVTLTASGVTLPSGAGLASDVLVPFFDDFMLIYTQSSTLKMSIIEVGANVSLGDTFTFDASDIGDGFAPMATNKLLAMYHDASNLFGRVFIDDTVDIAGILQESGTLGQSKPVALIADQDVSGVHSGLTMGSNYGISKADLTTLTTSYDIFLGVAESSTELHLYASPPRDIEAEIDALQLAVKPVLFAVKSADQSKSSTTTVTDDADLHVELEANSVYVFEIHQYTSCAGASIGIKTEFSYPAGLTVVGPLRYTRTSSDTENLYLAQSFSSLFYQQNYFAGSAFGTFTGVLFTTSSGTLTLRWAQQTSSATAITLKKGSYLKFTKMS